MAETISIEVPRAEAELIQAQIEECLRRIRQAHAELDRDRREIERLKEETRENLAEIQRLVA
jgi:chromosome segregation ATPase